MPKTYVKIACYESNASIISNLSQRLSKIIFFTASMFSQVVDVLRLPERALSLTSSRLSLNRLYHNWTGVLLIVFLWFFDPFFRIVKNTTNLFICQEQTDNSKWLMLSTYITDTCTNITEKMRKSNRCNSYNFKITVIFWSQLIFGILNKQQP